jgi:hypothetical protein
MMPNLDPYITEFISGNWLAITIFLTLLKGVAIMTPSATDNKIHELLSGLFGQIRGSNKR